MGSTGSRTLQVWAPPEPHKILGVLFSDLGETSGQGRKALGYFHGMSNPFRMLGLWDEEAGLWASMVDSRL